MSKNINRGSDSRRKDDYDGQGYFDLINGQVKVVFNEKKYPYSEGLVYEYYDSLLTILKMTGEVKKLMGFSTKIGNITDTVYNRCGGYPSQVVTDLPESLIDKASREAINNLLGRYVNAYLYGDFAPHEFEELLNEICRVFTTRVDDFRLGDLISSVKNAMGGRYNEKLIVLNDVKHKRSITPQRGRTTLNQFLNRIYAGMRIFNLNKNNTVRQYQQSSHNFNYSGYIRHWHSLERIEEAHAILDKRIEEQKAKTYASFSSVSNLVEQLGLDKSGKKPEDIVDSLIKETTRRDFWRKKIKEDRKKFAYLSHEQATNPALTITELDNMFKSRKSRRRDSSNNSP